MGWGFLNSEVMVFHDQLPLALSVYSESSTIQLIFGEKGLVSATSDCAGFLKQLLY